MAAWQFTFSLVPVAGILSVYGEMVDALPEYAARLPDAPFDEDADYPNYWEGIDQTFVHDMAKSVLPLTASWCEDATIYGDTKTDDIQIWEDNVIVRLNCGDLNLALLETIVAAARTNGCCLVLNEAGRIISPEYQLVLDALHASSAARFVKDPRTFLASIGRSFDA